MTLRTALAALVAAALGLGAAAPAEAQLWKPKGKAGPAKPAAANAKSKSKTKSKARSKATARPAKRTVSKKKPARDIADASVRVTSRRGDDDGDTSSARADRDDSGVDDAPRIYAINGGG